jgi:hypothetical protein
MRKKVFTSAISAITFLLFFCGVYRSDVDKEHYLELGRLPQFDCVGRVLHDNKEPGGSCILIDDRHVLSAAHVFIKSDSKPETRNINGKTITIYNQVNSRTGDPTDYLIELKGKIYQCRSLTIYPGYFDSSAHGGLDIALVELATPVSDVLPAMINTAQDELHTRVVGVGYGASGPAYPADKVKANSEKIGGENIIDSISGIPLNGIPTDLMADFDSPVNPELNTMGDSKPLPLEYGFAGGDSGGGLFCEKGGKWELIGICHRSTLTVEQVMKYGYYGIVMRWTRVSAFRDWIEETRKIPH